MSRSSSRGFVRGQIKGMWSVYFPRRTLEVLFLKPALRCEVQFVRRLQLRRDSVCVPSSKHLFLPAGLTLIHDNATSYI